MNPALRMGLVGCGRFGSHHARCLQTLPGVKLVAVCDTDIGRAHQLGSQLEVPSFENVEALAGRVDAVSIVVPAKALADVAMVALASGIHTLIEKPMADDLARALKMAETAARRNLTLQVGYLERYHPAITMLYKMRSRPEMIECVRMQPIDAHTSCAEVVLDIMTHDIDHVLRLMGGPPTTVHAERTLISGRQHIVVAKLGFSDGRTARLIAGRSDRSPERRIRIERSGESVTCDFLAQRVIGGADETLVFSSNPLRAQIEDFVQSVHTRATPRVAAADGVRTLQLALDIVKQCT